MQYDIKKATGEDNLAASFLKEAARVLAKPICNLINKSFSEGKFPTEWKCARIIALCKGGKRSLCNNYRPISILPILSKIIENHVHKSLYNYICENNLLCPNQSGFRPFHSCQTTLVDMINDFNIAMDQGCMIGCIAADLRKAFDVISHDILLKKLQIYGCNETCVKWFQSYLHERSQMVYLDNENKSTKSHVRYGIPQGSNLGPLCFSLYINDMPLIIPGVKVCMYADDTTIYVSGNSKEVIESKLQTALNSLTLWCNSNKMVINATKSHSMLVCNPQKRNFIRDVTACLRQIKHCLNKKNRLLFYNSYFLPVLDYCNVADVVKVKWINY